MIKTSQAVITALLIGCAAFQIKADQTNLVQNLNVDLSGLRQGKTVTNNNSIVTSADQVGVGTDQIIAALGAVIGNNFSRAANLVVSTPLAGGSSSIEIRDGGVSADVTKFFTLEQVGDSVETSVTNLRNGRFAESSYSIQRVALHDVSGYPALNLHFDVRGLAVESESSGGPDGIRNELDAGVSGVGDRNGRALLLQGSLRVRGRTLEVVNDELPPPA